MHLTPSILEAAYEYLRTTPPFNKWKLPHADGVEFCVDASTAEYGSYEFDLDQRKNDDLLHRITVSSFKAKSTLHLMETMSHEMTHLHQHVAGLKTRYRDVTHGPKFKRLATQVCKAHGFNLKTF